MKGPTKRPTVAHRWPPGAGDGACTSCTVTGLILTCKPTAENWHGPATAVPTTVTTATRSTRRQLG